MLTRVLVVIDCAAPWRVLSWVRRLLAPVGGEVRLLTVLPEARAIATDARTIAFADQVEDGERLRALSVLAGLAARLSGEGVVASVEVRFGDTAPAVVAAAGEWGAHAIAVAQTARRAWRGWRAGRVVNQILELTPVPVMVARATGQRFA